MQKLTKRILSLILAAVMCLTVLPLPALAAEDETQTEILELSPHLSEGEQYEPQGTVHSETNLENLQIPTPASDGVNRYMVLLLDTEKAFDMNVYNWYGGYTTIYTVRTPIDTIKRAANRFIDQVQKASGNNYVAIVTYDSGAELLYGFSSDAQALHDSVNNLREGEFGANIHQALTTARDILEQVDDENAIKNVILFSQGVNMAGPDTTDGPYVQADCEWQRSDTGIPIYQYSNATYNTARSMMDSYNLYTIGLFQSFDSVPERGKALLTFAKRFCNDIQNKGYYEVDDVDKLEFVFGDVAEDITTQRGTFKYPGVFIKDVDTVSEYVYTDAYFYESAVNYNPSLATMSYCLDLSAGSSMEVDEWPEKTRNAEALLTEIGFNSFAQNEFWDEAPTKDSIGLVAAKKELNVNGEDYVLIALAIRGGGYGSEWASNFTIGHIGDHDGFTEAKNNTLKFLKSYIDTYLANSGAPGKKNVKLWLVGFSRAGATAAMTAADINNGLFHSDHINPIAPEDLYCYTFEAAMGTHDSNKYGNHPNIHNSLNKSDLVPLVAPSNWSFSRYGVDHPFGADAATTAEYDKLVKSMTDQLDKMGFADEEYLIKDQYVCPSIQKYTLSIGIVGIADFWVPQGEIKTTQVIYEEGLTLLTDEITGGRPGYNATWETAVRDVLGVVMHADGMGEGVKQAILDMFTKNVAAYFLTPVFTLNPSYTIEERMDDIQHNIASYIDNAMPSGIEWITFSKSLELLINDIYKRCAKDLLLGNTDTVTTMVMFATALIESKFQAHYPEITIAWLRSQDPNYSDDIPQVSTSMISRIVRINCPVDVYVYDENGNLLTSIVADTVNSSSSLLASVSNYGEKTVYLPGDGEYRVEIVATDNGLVSVSMSEFDGLRLGTTRVMNYYDIPVQTGDTLTTQVPAIAREELDAGNPDGSSADYTLRGADGSDIPVDDSVTGVDAINEKHNVTIITEGNGGYATGAGSYIHGEFANLEAQCSPATDFYGWYIDGNLVSTEPIYRFAVRSDVEVTAKFSSPQVYSVTFEAGSGGIVENVDTWAFAGTTVLLSAKANSCCEFDHWSANAGTFTDAADPNAAFLMPEDNVTITAHWRQAENAQHELGEWYVAQSSTCTQGGVERRDCANCDFHEARPLALSDHQWRDNGSSERVCVHCGRTESGYMIRLDAVTAGTAASAWVDGVEYPLSSDASGSFVTVGTAAATNLVIYTMNENATEDVHTQYPTGMKVWMLKFENGAYTATYIPEFDNLLTYAGSSIRIVGVKGIRMITSVSKATKKALTSANGLAGYTLVEYGTALGWASDIDPNLGLTLGQTYTKSNYAYKKGAADPVFKQTATHIQYTNVLVGFDDDKCIPDIAMRPYIILEDAEGNQVTIYGGMIYRSIGYIAWQNRAAFQPKTAAYEYVWGIIHHVYGDQFDADYKK